VQTQPALLWASLAYLHAPCETHLVLYRQALRVLRAYLAALARFAEGPAHSEHRAALLARLAGLPGDAFPGLQPLLLQGLFWYHREVGADCLDALVDGWLRLPAPLMDRSDLGPLYLVLYAAVHVIAGHPTTTVRPPWQARRRRSKARADGRRKGTGGQSDVAALAGRLARTLEHLTMRTDFAHTAQALATWAGQRTTVPSGVWTDAAQQPLLDALARDLAAVHGRRAGPNVAGSSRAASVCQAQGVVADRTRARAGVCV
jgi:hypothetical protein